MMKRTTVPSWMVKVLVTAVIGALVSGAAVWGRTVSTKSNTHETRISVLEDHMRGIDEGQKDMNHKLDKIIDKMDKNDDRERARWRQPHIYGR